MLDETGGIDALDWAALEHAYGPADDIPGLLRALASAEAEAEARDEALDTLFSSLCHQGSVYSATAAAVPFLARLALDGPGHRLPLLWLLHGAADGTGPEHRRVRRAVATALPSLLALAGDADAGVRRAFVWTVAACAEASLPLLPLLRARLDEEDDAEARADLVTALGLLDPSPDGARARNRELLGARERPEPPEVRRAAVTDLLRTAPLPLPADLVETALDAHDAREEDETDHPWPASYVPLTDRLLDDPEAALRAVARGVPLAWDLTETWRDRERDVLPWLAAEVAAAEVADADAVDAEYLCGVARVGAALEGGEPAPWLDPHLRSEDPAVRMAATYAAVRLRVPGALGLVLRLMDESPEETRTLRLTPFTAPGVVVTAAVDVFGEAAEPVARRVAARPCAEWLDVLARFPALAATHTDALVRHLPTAPAATRVLAALGGTAGPAAARALRARAEAGDLAAAAALVRVTGGTGGAAVTAGTELALDAIRTAWDDVARRTEAVRVAGGLGPAAASLLPLLEERLRAPARESRADAAAAIWRVEGSTRDRDRDRNLAAVIADQLVRAGDVHEPYPAALRALTEMRLLPAEAGPAVEHLATSPRRVVSGFPCDGTPHPDLEVRSLARSLLTTTP
ncbi:hypothetical protein [Streptomyces sp. NPDC048172]|uniref:hypothetical protein n=1 Tax=Streptomyces sp. NPDC048172 TaxID=3365505 RepID=UPI003711EC30